MSKFKITLILILIIKFSVCYAAFNPNGYNGLSASFFHSPFLKTFLFDCEEKAFYPGFRIKFDERNDIDKYENPFFLFENCEIGEWSDIFDTFPNANKLVFSDSTLPSADFPEAGSLVTFEMYNSKFRTSSSLTLDATNLELFYFKGDQSNNIDNISLKNATKLNIINVENTTITDLPANMFENSIELKCVYFPFSKIKSIDSIIWPNSIETTNFDSNEIAKLTKRSFEHLGGMIILLLANNHIDTIEDGTFENVKELIWLDLSSNNISSLNEHTFGGSSKIAYLNLEENPIREFATDTFAHMSQLLLLNMSYGELDTVDFNAFAKTLNLTVLDLSNNNISRLIKMVPNAINGSKMEIATFHNTNSNKLGRTMKYLSLEKFETSTNTKIFSKLTSYKYLDGLQNEWKGSLGLKNLILSGNKLTAIENNTFAEFKQLKRLTLSRNPITTLYSESFAGLQNLTHLYMDHCRLTTIEFSVFTQLSRLETLDMSYNPIITITGASLPLLKILRLNNNELVSFPMIESDLPELRILDVRNNYNLNCSSMETFFEIRFHCGICADVC